MRKISFKGRRLDNGNWVEGDLVTFLTPVGSMTKNPAIHTTGGSIGTWFVDSDTVGQYTGYADADGKPVFEGDIMEFVLKPTRPSGNPETITGVAAWQPKDAKFVIDSRPYGGCRYCMKLASAGRIVGNIHEESPVKDAGHHI